MFCHDGEVDQCLKRDDSVFVSGLICVEDKGVLLTTKKDEDTSKVSIFEENQLLLTFEIEDLGKTSGLSRGA